MQAGEQKLEKRANRNSSCERLQARHTPACSVFSPMRGSSGAIANWIHPRHQAQLTGRHRFPLFREGYAPASKRCNFSFLPRLFSHNKQITRASLRQERLAFSVLRRINLAVATRNAEGNVRCRAGAGPWGCAAEKTRAGRSVWSAAEAG